MGSGEQVRVVELCLVGEDVRVRLGRHGERALSDVNSDRRPRDAAEVQ